MADFNLDGFPDLFFTGNMVSSRLYLNLAEKGRLRFKDISDEAGIRTDRWATGVFIEVVDDGIQFTIVVEIGSYAAIRITRVNFSPAWKPFPVSSALRCELYAIIMLRFCGMAVR